MSIFLDAIFSCFRLDTSVWYDSRRASLFCISSLSIVAVSLYLTEGAIFICDSILQEDSNMDTVIFLDYSEEVCMNGISERVGKERSDIPWTEDSLNPELVKWVKDFHTQDRPRLCSLIEKYSDKQVFIFNTRDQADKWLANL